MVDTKGFNKKYGFAIFVSCLIVFGSILAFFLVVRPMYISAGKLTKEAKEKQANLDTLEAKKQKLEELKSKQEELTKASQTVLAALPENKDAGRLFIQFDDLVKATGGKVNSVQESEGGSLEGAAVGATETAEVGSVKKVSYSVPVSLPNYFSLKDLLSRTEGALRLVNINNIGINSNNGVLDVTLTVDTFTR